MPAECPPSWRADKNIGGGLVKKIIILLLLLLLLANSFISIAATDKKQYLWKIGYNRGELIKQPNGPFEVMIFDHDAQGCYMGVVYYKIKDNGPVDATWKFSNCFWQEESWCADINSFAWSIDGEYLYVGTSEIYGNGRLFELDLYNKKARPIFPEEKDLKSWEEREYLMTEIKDINIQKNTIIVEVKTGKETIQKEIKML